MFYILVVAAVPVVLIAAFSFRAGANGIARHTDMHLSAVANVMAQGVSHWLISMEHSAGTFATILESSDQIDTLLSEPQDTQDSILAHLRSDASYAVATNPFIQRIDVLSPDLQQVFFSYGDGDINNGFAQNLPYLPPSDGIRMTLPPTIQGHAPQFATVESAVKKDGSILARLVVHVSTAPLMLTLSGEAALGDKGRVYLVNAEGLVLSSPANVDSREKPIRAPSEVIPMGAEAADGLRYTDLVGAEVVGAYAPVEFSDWFVVTEVPTSEAFSDIVRMRNTTIVATALFFILVVFVAALISRRVTQPVRVLSEGATQIGQGNLSHRIEVSGSDEIAKLATAFNDMAGDLDKTQTRLVAAERISALRKSTENNVQQLKNLSQMGLTIAYDLCQKIYSNESLDDGFLIRAVTYPKDGDDVKSLVRSAKIAIQAARSGQH